MSNVRTLEERVVNKQEQLDKLLQKAKQYQAQLKQLENRKADEDRRHRAHRLIEIGGAVESVLGREITHEELPLLIDYLKDQEKRGSYFSKAMAPKATGYEISDEEFPTSI